MDISFLRCPSWCNTIGPPQCSASVLSPRGFRRLCFSLAIRALVPAVPRGKPASNSRPLYAGRRLPSHQAPGRLIPEGIRAPGFDDIKLLNDASSMGLLSFVFRMHTCSRSCLELFLQRSPPRPFTAAAWSGLRPAPESRSRGACPHLSRSFTTPFSVVVLPSFPCVSAAHQSRRSSERGTPSGRVCGAATGSRRRSVLPANVGRIV